VVHIKLVSSGMTLCSVVEESPSPNTEVADSSEMLVTSYQTTCFHISEDSLLFIQLNLY
jgi:hypothetical protein